jgi:lysophospholipase L1-like esterase
LPRSFFPEVRTVRIAQARTALLAGACALVETSELGLRSDGIHFNTDGVRELGTRMAAELLQLPANQSQPIGVLR